MDRWFSPFWGPICFEALKRSSFLDAKFACFFEMSFLGVVLNDEVCNTILLETSHEDFWHWLLILPIMIQSARLWREFSFSVNKLCQSFPCKNSWVWDRITTNQSQPSLMVLNIFGTQFLLLGMMILSIFNSSNSCYQDLKTLQSALKFLFLNFGVSRSSSSELISCIIGFQFLQDFFIKHNPMQKLLNEAVY